MGGSVTNLTRDRQQLLSWKELWKSFNRSRNTAVNVTQRTDHPLYSKRNSIPYSLEQKSCELSGARTTDCLLLAGQSNMFARALGCVRDLCVCACIINSQLPALLLPLWPLQVPAESFESATVYFSDIVGFEDLCAESSPMQVSQQLSHIAFFFLHQIGVIQNRQ